MSKQAQPPELTLMAFGHTIMVLNWIDDEHVDVAVYQGVSMAYIREALETMLDSLSEFERKREAKRSY